MGHTVPLYVNMTFRYQTMGDIRQNHRAMKYKKSAESDVASAGIMSYKFLFVLKKIYFAVFNKLMG